jgi:hypothetical protein
MITCVCCGQSKIDKEFKTGKLKDALADTCRFCRETTPEDRERLQEKVAASTVSKMSGRYDPSPWHIRAGSDAFLRIPSRRLT